MIRNSGVRRIHRHGPRKIHRNMQRPVGMISMEVTVSQPADDAGVVVGRPLPLLHAAPPDVPPHDAPEAALRQRAHRQGFWPTIASSAVMVLLILVILLSFR